jgi:hypothetical protein
MQTGQRYYWFRTYALDGRRRKWLPMQCIPWFANHPVSLQALEILRDQRSPATSRTLASSKFSSAEKATKRSLEPPSRGREYVSLLSPWALYPRYTLNIKPPTPDDVLGNVMRSRQWYSVNAEDRASLNARHDDPKSRAR